MAKRGATGDPDPIDVAFGARMRFRRKAIGMSQAALGERIGASSRQVQRYEQGRNRVSASVLVVVARSLACSPAALLGDDDQTQAAEAELLSLLAVDGAIDLLETFIQIPDLETRAAVISVAQGLAGGAGERRPRRMRAAD
jgi:transcriptional regulator with XRE-family HTH domain